MSNQKQNPEIDYKKLVREMKEQGVFQKEPELNLMTRLGINVGGVLASSAFIACSIPVVGHVARGMSDFNEGRKMGYAVKMQQIQNSVAQKEREALERKKKLDLQPAPF